MLTQHKKFGHGIIYERKLNCLLEENFETTKQYEV